MLTMPFLSKWFSNKKGHLMRMATQQLQQHHKLSYRFFGDSVKEGAFKILAIWPGVTPYILHHAMLCLMCTLVDWTWVVSSLVVSHTYDFLFFCLYNWKHEVLWRQNNLLSFQTLSIFIQLHQNFRGFSKRKLLYNQLNCLPRQTFQIWVKI